MCFGPYPQSNKDFQLITQHKVTAVLNLQTESQMGERGVDWSQLSS